MKFLRGSLASGILVKEKRDYEYLRRYFENNWLQIQTCHTMNLNNEDETFQLTQSPQMLDVLGVLMISGCGVVVVIVLLGVAYEWMRKKTAGKGQIS